MKHIVTPAFALAMLAASASAIYSVRPVEQPWDSSLPAVTEWGDSFVLTREVKVEIDSPKTGKRAGYLFVAFDRSTGYYLSQLRYHYALATDPSITDTFRSRYRLAVSTRAIWAFDSQLRGGTLNLMEGNEKARNLDEAESKALKWAAGLTEDTEERLHRVHVNTLLGFIHPLGEPADNPEHTIEFVPQTLVGLASSNGVWQMTFDGLVQRDRNPPNEKQQHVRARLKVAGPWESGTARYSCVDDKSQETVCPQLGDR